MMSKHKHHIIPVYHCKELGIDPDFDENIVEVDRLDHARIHWGYKCDDLEPLFEYITPAQWIIDLIPRGDNRDSGAAVLTAKGELDGIDNIGKNHPMYGIPRSEETKKKISDAHTGKTSPFKGMPRSEWVKDYEGFLEKMSGENHWTHDLKLGEHPLNGFKHSEETKKKLSIANTGKKLTEETKEKIKIARANQIFTEEHIKSHADAMAVRRGIKLGPMSEEAKKKMIETKRRKHENGEYDYSWVKSGEEAGGYKDGRAVNARNDPEVMRAYKAEWYQNNKKKKAETQGEGTLKAFLR